MLLPITFLSALIALSTTLTVPTSPHIYRATQSNSSSFSPLPPLKPLPIKSNPPTTPNTLNLYSQANTTTTPPPPPTIVIWPQLPFTTDTGRHLNLTIARLGPITSRTRRGVLLNAISDLHYAVAAEGDPFEPISGVYARSSGIVWTVFACRGEVAMKRFQVAQVLSMVWILMEEYGPREVVGSEIVSAEGRGLASFVLRFLGG